MTLRWITILGVVLFGTITSAGDAPSRWTRFRGPNGNGLSTADTIPIAFTEKEFNWKVKLSGEGHSSPVIWNDKIFFTSIGGTPRLRRIVCLDTSDGHVRWTWTDTEFEEHPQHQLNSFASSTPTVDGERVYVTWTSGHRLRAVALGHNGGELWQRDLGPYEEAWGSGASPIARSSFSRC